MSEQFSHRTERLASLEDTARLAEASIDIGRVSIQANVGEEYHHVTGGRGGRPSTSYTGEVPEGMAYISIESNGQNSEIRQKADELAQQQAAQTERAA
jgi:hypothetical protein